MSPAFRGLVAFFVPVRSNFSLGIEVRRNGKAYGVEAVE